MKRLPSATVLALFLLAMPSAAQMSEARAEVVSRCFFIYAPIYEVGAKLHDGKLRSYATQRLMYVRGVIEASKSDLVFKRTFEGKLERNKAAAVLVEEDLLRAHKSKDAIRFNAVLAKASACDRELGL